MSETRDEIEFEHLINKLDKSIEEKKYEKSSKVINSIGKICEKNQLIKKKWEEECEVDSRYKKIIRKQIIINSIPKFVKNIYIKYRMNLARKRVHIKRLKEPSLKRMINMIKKTIEWVWSWTSIPSWQKYIKNYKYSEKVPSEKNIKNTSSLLKMAFFDTAMSGIFTYLMYDYFKDVKLDIEDFRLLGLTGTALTRGIAHRITLGFLAKAGAMTAVSTLVDSEMEAEKLDKQRIREMEILQSYISPVMINKIKSNENKEVEATIIFTDVRGYTKLSTEVESHELAKLLSLHFNLVNKIVEDYDGVMMKYIGDSAMFAFNLHKQKNPVDLAIASSIDIQRGMYNLNQYINEKYNCELPIGIGIATGRVTLTNIGGNFKDYTLIGDSVNLASRLNGVAKENEIIIDLNSKDKSQMKLDAKKLGLNIRRKEKMIEYDFENIGKVNLKGKGEVQAHKVLFNIK